ncbi:MAG: hypothetical protein RL648_1273, partial [Verrucomicrobiota bacterium]
MTNHHNIRLTLLMLPVLLAPIADAESLDQASPRPNILFIAIDDMNDWTGFLGGHPQAVTPNLDAVARKGVNFTNAHCPAPGCSPSRNALLYGVEPFHSGYYVFYDKEEVHQRLRESYLSLPQLFKESGYATYGAGKIHHGIRDNAAEWSDYHQPKNHKLHLKPGAVYQPDGTFKMSFGPTVNPLDEHPDYQVASYGVEVLSKQHEQPFFLAVGIVRPHLPFVCPEAFFDLYPDPVAPPLIKEDDLLDVPAVGRAMVRRADDNRFRKDAAWDAVRRAYLACVSWADFNVGRVIAALEASPYADNTIVVIWSDHGFALGEKHHFRKFALWEETTRVPFIIWDTRRKAGAGWSIEAGVSLINIYPTLVDMAGLKGPTYLDGYSLRPWLEDPTKPLSIPSICTWGRGNYTIRSAEFRYTRYHDGGEELYAHRDDPQEWSNLALEGQFADVKVALAAFLPKVEAPLVEDGIAPWSVPISADKPESK